MAKILIVDDEQDIIDILRLYLSTNQHAVLGSCNGSQALEIFNGEEIDLLVVDIMMPEMDGLELIKIIRRSSDIPVMMLTARDDITDKVQSFGLGVDDYLTKPFNPLEAVARIQALLRRAYGRQSCRYRQPRDVMEFSHIRLVKGSLQLEKGDRKIELTPKEYKMMLCLMENANRILTKKQLYELVWEERFFNEDENKLMVHISKLREKVEDDVKDPKLIKTVRGLGYVFETKKQ
jgi:DNA-binding response OmpR family regulator